MHRPDSGCEFRAVVDGLQPDGVVLHETRFVPAAADRASDLGVVGGIRVVSAERLADGTILHHLQSDSSWQSLLHIGDSVNAVVDWQSRFKMQRLHTALHLVYFAYTAINGPARRIARWVSPDEAYVEFHNTADPSDDVSVVAMSEWVRRAVIDDLTILSMCDTAVASRQYWHIDGIGTLACTGSHPYSTADVGDVSLAAVTFDENSTRIVVRVL